MGFRSEHSNLLAMVWAFQLPGPWISCKTRRTRASRSLWRTLRSASFRVLAIDEAAPRSRERFSQRTGAMLVNGSDSCRSLD